MITPGALASSGAVRPFYDRGVSGPSIVRTLVTTFTTATNEQPLQITFASGLIPANMMVLAGFWYDNAGAVGPIIPTWLTDARPFTQDVGTFGFPDSYSGICSCPLGGSSLNSTLSMDFTMGAGDLPFNVAVILIYVSNLRQSAPTFDVGAFDTQATGTTQDSGLTAATAVASSFVWGIIGTSGNDGTDTIGTWQAGLTAGTHVGNAAQQLKEGYRVTSATGQQRAEVTGATDRSWAASCAVYEGA